MKVPGARLIDALKTALKICFRRGEKFWQHEYAVWLPELRSPTVVNAKFYEFSCQPLFSLGGLKCKFICLRFRQAIPTCMLKGVPLASNFRISTWASSKRIAIAETSGDDRP